MSLSFPTSEIMQPTIRNPSIDSLRRNPIDGAYHCPRCDAPFTRRSNLRRHYHIHTRNTIHKCQHCSQTFSHSDDLRSHSVECNSALWDQSMMEAMMHYTPEGGIQHNIEFSEGLGIVSAPIVGNPLYEHPPAIADDLVNVDLFSQPDGLKYHEESTQGLQHFFSSTLSEGCTSPSTSSEMMSTADYPFPYAPSSRSSVSSSHISPSPPSIFTPGPYISPEEQATWNEYNPMEVPGVKQSPAETPIYTRKQVEDMLNVVGNCFLETIDAILQKTQAADLHFGRGIPELQTLAGSQGDSSSISVEVRRMILMETIPRLMGSLRDDAFRIDLHPKV